MNKVRGAAVNKFGEETQELYLKPLGKWRELRLLPRCGYGLEECACGASSSPPRPVHDGSLREAIEDAVKEASAAAAAAAAGGVDQGKRGNDSRGRHDDGRRFAGSSAAAEREAKRRRLELERSKDAFEEETRAASGGGSCSSGNRGGGMTGKASSAQEGRDRGHGLDGRGDGSADDGVPTVGQ